MKENVQNNNGGFDTPKDYFESSAALIMSRISITASKDEFDVPVGYFESSREKILNETRETPVISIFNWKKLLVYAGSAAAVAVLVFQVFRQEEKIQQPSFAELLNSAEFNEEVVLEEATLEEVIEYYSSEFNAVIADSSNAQIDMKAATDTTNRKIEKGLKRKKEIKPNTEKVNQKINELSEEEILKYLIEEGGDSYEIQ